MARYIVGWFSDAVQPEDAGIIHECQSFSESVDFLRNHFRWMAEDWPELADRCWELAQELAGSDISRHLDGGRFHIQLGPHTYYIARPEGTDPHGGIF